MTETVTTADASQDTDALTAYKAQVRAKALELQARFGWCRDETNDHLAALGLEILPVPQEYVFQVPTKGVMEYRITAYTPEQAEAHARRKAEADVMRLARPSGYRAPVGAVVEVTSDITKLALKTSSPAPDAEYVYDEDDN